MTNIKNETVQNIKAILENVHSGSFSQDENVPRGTFLLDENDLQRTFTQSRIDEYLIKIQNYIELLLIWNDKINLIAKSTINDIYQRHVLDSLQLIKYIDIKPKQNITDLGSGAGFPGVVIAMLNLFNVNLIESKQKKCNFLAQATKDLSNVKIFNSRIEDLPKIKSGVIIARALAPLNDLLSLAVRFNHKDIKYIFLKGEQIESEINLAQKNWKFDHNLFPSLTNNKAFIIIISNLRKKVIK